MRTELCIEVKGTEVWLQGEGDEVILMLHGWPDTGLRFNPPKPCLF